MIDKLLQDSVLQNRVDHLIDDCKMFYEYGLYTTLTQVRQDMRYIKVVCQMSNTDHKPYIDYYKQGLRSFNVE